MWSGRRSAGIGAYLRLHKRREATLILSHPGRLAAFVCFSATLQNRTIKAIRPIGMASKVDLSRHWMHAAALICLAPLGEPAGCRGM
jgi:hypothetical protein